MSFPETVQALVYTGAGGPEVIDKIAIPFPKQGADEVVVKVRSSVWTRCRETDQDGNARLYTEA